MFRPGGYEPRLTCTHDHDTLNAARAADVPRVSGAVDREDRAISDLIDCRNTSRLVGRDVAAVRRKPRGMVLVWGAAVGCGHFMPPWTRVLRPLPDAPRTGPGRTKLY
eukprot:172194-Prymnesium_polylepis.1